jgi:hypothetical protein
MSHACYAVLFAPGFHHVGVHYIDADGHQTNGTRVDLLRDDRVVWSSPARHVAELRRFDNRVAANAFHKVMRAELLEGRGPAEGVARRPGSSISSTRSPVIEGVLIRVVEP